MCCHDAPAISDMIPDLRLNPLCSDRAEEQLGWSSVFTQSRDDDDRRGGTRWSQCPSARSESFNLGIVEKLFGGIKASLEATARKAFECFVVATLTR